MEYKVQLDDDANLYLSGANSRNSGAELTGSDLCVQLGKEFEIRVGLDTVAGVEQMADPRPEVYLPLGVSAAVDRLGRDTLAAIGSYDGLVIIHFKEMVDARVAPTGGSAAERTAADQAPVKLQNLIVSLEDPEGFVSRLKEQVGSAARTIETSTP